MIARTQCRYNLPRGIFFHSIFSCMYSIFDCHGSSMGDNFLFLNYFGIFMFSRRRYCMISIWSDEMKKRWIRENVLQCQR